MPPAARAHLALAGGLAAASARPPKRVAFQARGVALDAATALPANDDATATAWIQVAAAGQYLGHPSGPFAFDAVVFDELIANFRAHPAFVPGPDGEGSTDVVAFDFHHASEKPAAQVAVLGAPAQAWAQDLQARTGPGGELQLWAKTRYLEPARTYVKQGAYKWTSVAVYPDSSHPITGERIGWYLSSIAFTNDPFIQGMVPIAATREHAAQALRLGYYLDPYNPTKTVDDVVAALREVLGLDKLAELSVIFAELAKLRNMATVPGAAPAGVDVAEIVGTLRILLNLPTLSDAATVFGELDKLLAALAETAASPTNLTPSRGSSTMSLRSFLLGRLSLAAETSDDILAERVAKLLDGGKEAQDRLVAICKITGQADPEAAALDMIEKYKAAAELEKIVPEIAAFKEEKMKAETAAAEGDVEEVMASRGYGDEAREILLTYRTAKPAEFAKKFPKPTAEERKLLGSVATTRSTSTAGARTLSASRGVAESGLGDFGACTADELAKMPGATNVERGMALAHKRAKEAGETLSHADAHAAGIALARSVERPSLSAI